TRAEAEALASRHDTDRVRLAIAQEVRSAVTRYDIARARVQRFADGFLRQAREARRAAEASYREGAVSLLEFLAAERTAIPTPRDELDALPEVNPAALEVRRAAALEVSPGESRRCSCSSSPVRRRVAITTASTRPPPRPSGRSRRRSSPSCASPRWPRSSAPTSPTSRARSSSTRSGRRG